jgi:hypothetical protein
MCYWKFRLILAVMLFSLSGVLLADTINLDFSTDPGWTEYQNRSGGNNFGYSGTNHVDPASLPGEIGGIFSHAIKAYYGDAFDSSFSLDDTFTASGKFLFVNQSSDANRNIQIGYFSTDVLSQSFIGFALIEGGPIQGLPNNIVRIQTQFGPNSHGDQYNLPLGSIHTWEFDYDPIGNGSLTLILDGNLISIMNLTAAQRSSFGEYNAFGLSLDGSGLGSLEAYIDNVTYDVPTVPEPPTLCLLLVGFPVIWLGFVKTRGLNHR